MKLGLGQSLRTDVALRLSPQILQRIEVLQLPAIDLAAMVEQELQENEALEVDHELEPPEADSDGDDDLSDLYADDTDDWRPANTDGGETTSDILAATEAAPLSLAQHLDAQLDLADLEPRILALARGIVEALNARGWLEVSFDALSVPLDPPARESEWEAALRVVQRFDPPGVGCRDLVECLLLQLDEADAEYPLLATLVLDHLEDIARNRVPRIVKATGRPVEELLVAIDTISHLDPVPGMRFGGERVPHVHPDVIVERSGDDYEIRLDNDWLPSLRVSRTSRELAADRGTDPELRKHMRGKIEAARSLIDAVAQRKHTLFRMASELVNRQGEFLEHGRAALRPLRMQEVADALGVHVSTVSRAIAGKSMQTPRGIVFMRDLFTGEVPGKEGAAGSEGESRAAVQELVRSIVAAEDSSKPLSDEAIVRVLSEQHGLAIARRTVTKYRKALGIGSSRARRVYG